LQSIQLMAEDHAHRLVLAVLIVELVVVAKTKSPARIAINIQM